MLIRPVDTLFSLIFSPTCSFCSFVYPVNFSVTLCYSFLSPSLFPSVAFLLNRSLVIWASPSFLFWLLIHMGD
uniref:Uncharacterized protein n=1 Tax=Aotus nancymaae TaxID=37293 RepID=A0A2K5F8D9_AOTNA